MLEKGEFLKALQSRSKANSKNGDKELLRIAEKVDFLEHPA